VFEAFLLGEFNEGEGYQKAGSPSEMPFGMGCKMQRVGLQSFSNLVYRGKG